RPSHATWRACPPPSWATAPASARPSWRTNPSPARGGSVANAKPSDDGGASERQRTTLFEPARIEALFRTPIDPRPLRGVGPLPPQAGEGFRQDIGHAAPSRTSGVQRARRRAR